MARAIRPKPELRLSEYADLHGRLIGDGDPPPQWFTRAPQRAVLDAFSEPEIEFVAVQKSTRVGWTKIIGLVTQSNIHHYGLSTLIVQPTKGDAAEYSKDEIEPMLVETPVLSELIGQRSKRDPDNARTSKTFPGDIKLYIRGANSPGGARRISVDFVLLDECDGYPLTAGKEGDQVVLFTRRADESDRRTIGIGSTPTEDGISRIQRHMGLSSCGYYVVQCPFPKCGNRHTRKFREPEDPIVLRDQVLPVSFLEWDDGDPHTAGWRCPGCHKRIGYAHHRDMCDAGMWFGEHWAWSPKDGFSFEPGFAGRIGFYLWAGFSYSPNATPETLVREFLDAKKDPESLKTFVNTVFGEVWTQPGEAVNPHVLMKRRETYSAEVPTGGRLVYGAADRQRDRIELEILSIGDGWESWNIDYEIFLGDTLQPDVWEEFRDYIRSMRWEHEGGAQLSLTAVAVDAGDQQTDTVARIADMGLYWVYPIKAMPGSRPVIQSTIQKKLAARRRRRNIPVEILGSEELTRLVLERLRVHEPGPGYCHFPMERDDEYFEQLTADRIVTYYKRGQVRRRVEQMRPRNEAHDCRKYAYAAAHIDLRQRKLSLADALREADREIARSTRTTPTPRRTPRASGGFGSDEWSERL